ncbi:hypothetical protein ACQ4LE_003723 [Meloidogyne hapla]|uniref:DUF148 domain-containing protein n=1 Tax=Meloidogyne hapla TaxID=6305 RepID=A0A1I8B0R7_MELHA
MAAFEMDVDALLADNNNEENLPPKDGENGIQKVSTKNKKNNTLLENIQKESETTRETIIKVHDKIREALSSQQKAIVEEILQEINPRFLEIETSLNELKIQLQNLSAESEALSDSVSVAGLEEEPPINEEPIQNAQQNIQQQAPQENEQHIRREARGNEQQYRREARELGNNRGQPRGGRRTRDARLFFLLRQLERERANDRFNPYRPGRGGYGGGNHQLGHRRDYYRRGN